MELVAVACIAPEFTDELLAKYKDMIDLLDPRSQVRDILEKLFRCAMEWWNYRESTEKSVVRATGTDITRGPNVRLQMLDEEAKNQFFDFVPWMDELNAYGEVLDREFPHPARETERNAAFHLLWLAKELCLDREPITKDRIVV